jgi:hypothetical protein
VLVLPVLAVASVPLEPPQPSIGRAAALAISQRRDVRRLLAIRIIRVRSAARL